MLQHMLCSINGQPASCKTTAHIRCYVGVYVCVCVCVRVCAHGALAPLPHHASDRVALPCASVIFGLCLERLPMVLALRLQARAKICRERLSCCACLLPGIPEMVPPSPLSSAGFPRATSGVPG